jgi:hypothetical protein
MALFDATTGDVGNIHKDSTSTSDTLSPHDNTSTSIGSGNRDDHSTHDDHSTRGDRSTHDDHSAHDDHSMRDDHSNNQAGLFNFNFGAQAAHDAAPHEGAAVHHGGHHPDPTVLALQERLLANGFDPGSLDGVMGPQTEAALAAEQAAYEHQQHGGYGEHGAQHHGEHGGYGYDAQEYHHGGHGEYGYEHGGYGHEGYPHDGYDAQEYHHADYAEAVEEHGHQHYGDNEAAHAEAYPDETYEMEGAQAGW